MTPARRHAGRAKKSAQLALRAEPGVLGKYRGGENMKINQVSY